MKTIQTPPMISFSSILDPQVRLSEHQMIARLARMHEALGCQRRLQFHLKEAIVQDQQSVEGAKQELAICTQLYERTLAIFN